MTTKLLEQDNDIRLAFAASDFYQLLSLSMQFPSEELAAALSDGSYQEDGIAILGELSCSNDDSSVILGDFDHLNKSKDPAQLLKELRCEYTRLFNDPKKPQLEIYESLFRNSQVENKEKPMLFLSPEAIDAENCYKNAGLKVETNFGEPADHIATELEFLMFLYGNKGKALRENNLSELETTNHHIQKFRKSHLDKWGYKFFDCLEETTTLVHYKLIARLAMKGLNSVMDTKEVAFFK